MKKVFTDKLPKNGTGQTINWIDSIGLKVKFIYDDIEGEVKIIDYIREGQQLYIMIKYIDEELFKIEISNFINCKLGKLLKKHTNEFKVEIGTVLKDNKRNIVITDRKVIKKEINKNNKN